MKLILKHFFYAIMLFNVFNITHASEKPKESKSVSLNEASQTTAHPTNDQKLSLKNAIAHAQASQANLFGDDDGTSEILGQARIAYNTYWKQALLYRNQNPSYKVLSFSEFIDPANAQKK